MTNWIKVSDIPEVVMDIKAAFNAEHIALEYAEYAPFIVRSLMKTGYKISAPQEPQKDKTL